MNRNTLDDIYRYLTKKKFWPGATKEEKEKFITKTVKHFKVEDGKLYKDNKLVVDEIQRIGIIEQLHVKKDTHYSFKQTVLKVKEKYYWDDMFIDIATYVKETCGVCKEQHRSWNMLEIHVGRHIINPENTIFSLNVIDVVDGKNEFFKIQTLSPWEVAKTLFTFYTTVGFPAVMHFFVASGLKSSVSIVAFTREMLLLKDKYKAKIVGNSDFSMNYVLETPGESIPNVPSLRRFQKERQKSFKSWGTLCSVIEASNSLLGDEVREQYNLQLQKIIESDSWPNDIDVKKAVSNQREFSLTQNNEGLASKKTNKRDRDASEDGKDTECSSKRRCLQNPHQDTEEDAIEEMEKEENDEIRSEGVSNSQEGQNSKKDASCDDSRKFPCTIEPNCTYVGKIKGALTAHVKNMHLNKIHKCDECHLSFNTEKKLNSHKDLEHNPARIFGCRECTYKAKTSKNLSKHKRRLGHRTLVHLLCPVCLKLFNYQELRKHHQEVHSNLPV